VGCQAALLGGWTFSMGLQDDGNSNDGNRCLWPLSGSAALVFPPSYLHLSAIPQLPFCMAWSRGEEQCGLEQLNLP